MYKPSGYTSVAPYLVVSDGAVVQAFLKAVFGVEPIFIQDEADGGGRHFEFRIDDTILMMGQMPGATSTAHVHVYVADVDATFARATRAGGKVVQEPTHKGGEPDRRCGIADPSGTTWWFATQQVER